MQLRAFALTAATSEFHRKLVEEHIDEASFLYQQRQGLLQEPDAPWMRVAAAEQRLEAHLDALAVAGRSALDACLSRAIDPANPGALFVATCIACRSGESARLALLLDRAQDQEEGTLVPLRDALRIEMPDEWMPLVLQRLSASRPAWVGMLADISRPDQPAVVRALLKALQHRIAVASVAAALGRWKVDAARADLWRCLADQSADIRAAALLALCRIGDGEATLHGVSLARRQPWARAVVGVSGGRVAVRTLTRIADDGAADVPAIEALGLLGDPEAFRILLSALSDAELAATAARSLHWITGAALFDEAFVPDPVDEALMSPSELADWNERQQQPTRADGQPFGANVRTLTRDPQRWQRWLGEHADQFRSGRRYRGGRPCTARSTVESLGDPGADRQLRRGAALELAIRYGCAIPFDAETPVTAQRALLGRMLWWAGERSWGSDPGAWTYAGQAQ